MNLFLFFQKKSRWFYFFTFLLGAVSSLSNIGILMLINDALGGKSFLSGKYNYLVFILFISVSFVTNILFQHYMIKLANNIMFEQELAIIRKVRNASFESFERMGSEKIFSILNDTRSLARIPQILITLLNSTIICICALCYLFWIAPLGGIVVFVLMSGLLIVYLVRGKIIEKDLNELRDLQDGYFKSLGELINGFKQIRISVRRNNNLFHKHINQNRGRAEFLTVRISRKYMANEMLGTYSWYLVLGAVIFVLPLLFHITIAQTAVFVATVLFMMGPLSQIVTFFPWYSSLKIVVDRIHKIDVQLRMDAVPVPESLLIPDKFSSIRFENLIYRYQEENKNPFYLEIDDLRLDREEIIFITGGNGSGKTTFINILTGLCRPESGKVFIDEKEVSWDEFSLFNNNMAVVYTSQYMFSENYDEHDISETNAQLNSLRDLMNLSGILKLTDGRNWLDTNLSKGQQKRLSLLLALLESKPIVVLDEWAAEQDPYNRHLFYTKWLPMIKEMNKTIIAISHDDDFYHLADRVIKFSYGKIASDIRQIPQTA